MMVSTASDVLPVPRSPMISSRWPLPSGIIASTTIRPVSSGLVTRSRSTIAGEGCSTGAKARVRPARRRHRAAGPARRPTAKQFLADGHAGNLARAVHEAAGRHQRRRRRAARIRSDSRRDRRRARARHCRNSRTSSSRVSGRPETVATPSPTWTTRPTLSSRADMESVSIRARLFSIHSRRSSGSVVIAGPPPCATCRACRPR